MIKREQFINPIRPFYEIMDLIKVIMGIRRCGKSVLLMQIADELREKGIDEKHIIFINFELFEYSSVKTAEALHDYITERVTDKEKYFVFLDEVQMVEKFELVVNSLRTHGNISIFITGSGHLLSGELATVLSGRYVSFRLTPFTFSEVKLLTNETDNRKLLVEYMKWGGLPGRFVFQSENETRKYLQDVYDSIILRDIIQRSGLRDLNLLENIIQFMIDNTGKIFSANTISKYLKSQSRGVSAEALYNYIGYLVSSLLFNKVYRYDINGKNVFATLEKYYIVDLGLLQLKRSFISENFGSRLETIVANELLARGYKINVGTQKDDEIDFVATPTTGEIEYYQVAYTAKEGDTLDRELAPLQKIKDNYRKIVLTTDEFEWNHAGIEQLNVEKWLLNK
ncbi:MAG: ATP-binding protein [Tannerella sp.]|jgi:predicted AAA+ superfamily ATPase|nr:ATP-binding protein [Tannerella sp.]